MINNPGIPASVVKATSGGAPRVYNLGADAFGNMAIGTAWPSLIPGVNGTGNPSNGENVAIGDGAMAAETTPNGETAVGAGAMAAMQNGLQNVAVGQQAMGLATGPAKENVAVGPQALQHLTGGPLAGNQGAFNVAVGPQAAQNLGTGFSNVAVGSSAMQAAAVSGDHNVAVGESSLLNVAAGASNTAVGGLAGAAVVGANGVTAIGGGAGNTGSTDSSNMTLLGKNTAGSAAGAVAIGTDNTGAGAAATAQNAFVLGTANHAVNAPGSLAIAGIKVPAQVQTTGAAGYALQNAANVTILTWTAPNDGALHRALIYSLLHVQTATTGGEIDIFITGQSGNLSFYSATHASTGNSLPDGFDGAVIVLPNTTVALIQRTAMTAGAATLFAEIWAS